MPKRSKISLTKEEKEMRRARALVDGENKQARLAAAAAKMAAAAAKMTKRERLKAVKPPPKPRRNC